MFNKKPSLLDRYEDPTGTFPNQTLRAATWYAKHHTTLRKVIVSVLTVWSVATLGTSLVFLGKYFIFDYQTDQANLQNLSYSYLPSHAGQRFTPTALQFTAAELFSGIENRYDFFAEVTNPNREWIAVVTYRFTSALGATESREATILPDTRRSLVLLGYESTEYPSGPALEIVSLGWKRIDPHEISDPVLYRDQRISVSVGDFSYTPANRSENIAAPIVRFSLTNNSVFDFWEFPALIRFERGGQLVGLAPLSLSQFVGGEVRALSVGVFSEDALIDSVTVEPLVNVFDPGVFMNR